MPAHEAGMLQVFSHQLERYRDPQLATDFVLVCGDKSWNVHKAILALHSSVLERASENGFKETIEARLKFNEDPEFAVEAMIHYMYNFDYEQPDSLTHEQALEDLAYHLHVCIVADKWGVTTLKAYATNNFLEVLSTGSFSQSDFANAAEVAYQHMEPTREIRGAIVTRAAGSRSWLAGDGAESVLEKVMLSCPQLAADILRAQPRGPVTFEAERRFRCECCNQTMVADIPPTRVKAAHCYSCTYTGYLRSVEE